ncbi:hypothetical protein K7X08_020687 [Anisodus acutangulus]|uniref:Cytochrome P450 n=1 Tax=Anisodus acutangulus TaxID=402998 RepID=A0A9Q1MSY1_9SOLA|nr:hypothetical protein K7X08_020687 [Anisodus acutangulus]
MEITTSTIAVLICGVRLGIWSWRFLNWLWFNPEKLEKYLRQQGLNGNSYRLLCGDLKEGYMMSKEAKSKAMNFSNDIAPRVSHLLHKTFTTYGKIAFTWFGPRPVVFINDAEIVKEIFSKPYIFLKPENYHTI